MELFNFGQREAQSRGLLLVDTKYEFGRDADGNILLVDEVRLSNLYIFAHYWSSWRQVRRTRAVSPWALTGHAASRNVGQPGNGQPLVRAYAPSPQIVIAYRCDAATWSISQYGRTALQRNASRLC